MDSRRFSENELDDDRLTGGHGNVGNLLAAWGLENGRTGSRAVQGEAAFGVAERGRQCRSSQSWSSTTGNGSITFGADMGATMVHAVRIRMLERIEVNPMLPI